MQTEQDRPEPDIFSVQEMSSLPLAYFFEHVACQNSVGLLHNKHSGRCALLPQDMGSPLQPKWLQKLVLCLYGHQAELSASRSVQ